MKKNLIAVFDIKDENGKIEIAKDDRVTWDSETGEAIVTNGYHGGNRIKLTKQIIESHFKDSPYFVEEEAGKGKSITSTNDRIKEHLFGFSQSQQKNIEQIVNSVTDKMNGKIDSFASGGGHNHLFIQLKDNRWVGFHSGSGNITLSEPFEKFSDFQDDWWENDGDKAMAYYPENFDKDESSDQFVDVKNAILDIKENNFIIKAGKGKQLPPANERVERDEAWVERNFYPTDVNHIKNIKPETQTSATSKGNITFWIKKISDGKYSVHHTMREFGNGTKIENMENKNYYYLKPGALFKDSGGVKFKITGHTPTSLKVRRFSEVEKNTPEIEIPYTEVLDLVSDKKMVFDDHSIDKIREFRLLEMEIENIKLNLHHQDSIKTYQAELENASTMLEAKNAEIYQLKKEANALMDDLGKKSADFKDSMGAMEAIAKKEKKTNLIYKGVSEDEIEENYGKLAGPNQLTKKEHEYLRKLHKALIYFEKEPKSRFFGGKAGKGTQVSDYDSKLEAFLKKFPDNAKSWAQATDEMRDLAREIRERYNEDRDLQEGDKGYVDAIDFRSIKTPSEWNKKAKKQIRKLWAKFGDYSKKSILNSHEGWFE